MHTNPESACSMQIQMIDLDGQILRVATWRGSDASPPLLIFNGIAATRDLVEPFVTALEDVSVIIFDVPGVGGSPAPVVPYRFSTLSVLTDRLLTRLGHEGAGDGLGVSWGGALAQQLARLYPGRCRRLILAATSPGVIMVPAKLSVLSKLLGPRRYTDPAYLQEVGADIYGGAYRRNPSLLKAHSRHIQPPRGRGYLYQLLAATGWSSLPWLGAVRQKTPAMDGSPHPTRTLT